MLRPKESTSTWPSNPRRIVGGTILFNAGSATARPARAAIQPQPPADSPARKTADPIIKIKGALDRWRLAALSGGIRPMRTASTPHPIKSGGIATAMVHRQPTVLASSAPKGGPRSPVTTHIPDSKDSIFGRRFVG